MEQHSVLVTNSNSYPTPNNSYLGLGFIQTATQTLNFAIQIHQQIAFLEFKILMLDGVSYCYYATDVVQYTLKNDDLPFKVKL